jgi:acyl-CoA thioesterase
MKPESQSTGPHKFHMDAWISCAPFEQLLHMIILDASNGRALLSMPFHIEFAQGAGLMHGGALVSLADTTVAMAVKSILAPETHFATISLESKFLYPVKQGIVTARGKVTKREGRVLWGRATVLNEAHKAVMEFWSTYKLAKDTRIRDISFSQPPS